MKTVDFGTVGLYPTEDGQGYVSSIIIDQAFWKLEPTTREKMLVGWGIALEKLQEYSNNLTKERKSEFTGKVVDIADYFKDKD